MLHFGKPLLSGQLAHSQGRPLNRGLTVVNLPSLTVSHWFSQMAYFFLITERKLESNEFPHNLYIRTYSALSTTSLALRKWIFTLARVCTRLCWSADLLLYNFNYWYIQAIQCVCLGRQGFQLIILAIRMYCEQKIIKNENR